MHLPQPNEVWIRNQRQPKRKLPASVRVLRVFTNKTNRRRYVAFMDEFDGSYEEVLTVDMFFQFFVYDRTEPGKPKPKKGKRKTAWEWLLEG